MKRRDYAGNVYQALFRDPQRMSRIKLGNEAGYRPINKDFIIFRYSTLWLLVTTADCSKQMSSTEQPGVSKLLHLMPVAFLWLVIHEV